MRLSFLSLICLGFLLIGNCWYAGAMEIELSGGMNFMTFHPDRVTAHGESINYKEFKEYPFIFGDFYLKNEISDKMGFNIHAQRDNILRNSLSGTVTASTEYFNVEFGPFIGINDNFDKPDAGIMGRMELLYPGIAFLSLSGSSSLGSQYKFMGDNGRETAEISLGFWLPNTIVNICANFKSYTRQAEDTEIRDELIRIIVSPEYFIKNAPITVRLDAGYEILSRSYKRVNKNIKDELSAVFAGLQVKWQLTKPLRVNAGFEIPLYCVVTEPMKNPANYFLLYKFNGGIVYSFF